ncbi:MAG: NAD-dependent epimerase/dehydratase family protein [Thaumarchaeota archaeon]|nr:MAG: NAD-dependent epimerase/dehydratase family protein [Nitrososphaerota archaeon]
MKRRAVVTGGAGFIGSHLSQLLLRNGYDVVVYDDFSNGSGRKNLSKNIKIVKGSILNPGKFRSICRNCDVVFHLAVKPLIMSFDRPEEVVKVNDYGTYLVAKTCTELNCKMIHVSSSEAYGTALSLPMKENHPLLPHTIYAGSKAASELYVRGFHKTEGLKMVIVRPFNSYGEYMRDDTYAAAIPNFYNRISKGLPLIIHGTGKQTRDFTYVGDTCHGIMLADQNEDALSKTFNIGQGHEESIKKIAEIMIRKYQEITGREIKKEMKFQKPRKGDVMRHLADISSAKRILGYKPTTTMEKGIIKYITWKLTKVA